MKIGVLGGRILTMKIGVLGGRILTMKIGVLGGRPVPVTVCPPQISQEVVNLLTYRANIILNTKIKLYFLRRLHVLLRFL